MRVFFIVFLVLFSSCKKTPNANNNVIDPNEDEWMEMTYSVNSLSLDSSYYGISKVGNLENNQLTELSGLAPCSYRSDWLYAHNDGGDSCRMFIIDTTGKHVKSIVIPNGGNRDMEDMAVDPTPINGKTYVYLADIGDNNAVYPEIKIYRFQEEKFQADARDTATQLAQTLRFVYPDGPRDAEALWVDPWTHHLYVVTKRDAKTSVYKASYPFNDSTVNTLKNIATLPFNGVVGGDISTDGKKIVLKTYLQILIWVRKEGETLLNALSKQPKKLPYTIENQGESFCWSRDGNTYFTISEGLNAPVFKGIKK